MNGTRSQGACTNVKQSRQAIVGVLRTSPIIAAIQNKVKHGPQLILDSPAPSASGAVLHQTWVRLLFTGANVAMNQTNASNSHLFLHDDGSDVDLAVEQLRSISRQLFMLASWTYFFTFDSWAHVDQLNVVRIPEGWMSASGLRALS